MLCILGKGQCPVRIAGRTVDSIVLAEVACTVTEVPIARCRVRLSGGSMPWIP